MLSLHRRRWRRSISTAISALQTLVARNLWPTGAILALVTLSGGAVAISDMHQRELEDAKSELRDMGLVLTVQAAGAIQVVDLLLRDMQSSIRALGNLTPDDFRRRLRGQEVHQFLIERSRNLPQIRSTSLFDSDGVLVNSSRDAVLPAATIAGRDDFEHARDHTDSGMFVSEPASEDGTDLTSVFLSRRISGPDGAFLGLAVTSVDLDYLLELYRTVNEERGLAVTLLRRDGLMLARYPASTRAAGSMPHGSAWYERVAAGGGLYLSLGYFSGVNAIVSVHPLRDFPLVLDVSVHVVDVLQIWRRQTAYMGAAAITLACVLLGLFGMISRQMRRQVDQNARLLRSAIALQTSERELRAFAEMSADWFWQQGPDLRFVRDSEISLTSQPSDVGKTRWDFADPEMDPDRWVPHKAALAARLPFRDFRWERIQIDGKRRYMSTSGDPNFDETGTFLGYHGTGRDITAEVEGAVERRAAKERAEQAEALLRDAVGSMSEGFVIYDRDDRFIMCNDKYREGFRRTYSRGAEALLAGAHLEDILRHIVASGGAGNAACGREAEWVAERVRYHREAHGDLEQRLDDGSWYLVTNRRMENGGVAGLRIDITALKQAQAALQQGEARLDRAQATAGIGSWELDLATGRYIWSKELYRIRGVSPESFAPSIDNVSILVHPDDDSHLRAWLAGLTAGSEPEAGEMRIIRPDGDVRLLRVEGRGVTDRDGVVRHLAGTMQDVTDRRLIERQLAQAQKMEAIGNLTGGMAHDFNNGLAVIIGNLDLLGRRIKTDPGSTELCDEARDGAFRCADLIRLLLAFARRQPLDPHQVDVNALTERTARLLGRTLGEDITLTLDLGVGLSPVLVDAAQLEAALANLANNARDAMPRGGRLDITTKAAELDVQYATLHPEARAGMYVLIEVSDTGSGIEPGIIGNIFEPFFTTKEAGQGTGLGLSMVFGFVKQSGGHLAVYSEPGLGTTFRIYLPPARADAANDPMPVDPGPVAGGHETVLLVEDNAALRHATARQLADLGYRVREAEHAAAASAILASGDRVDLLFTDIVMPGPMDGLDLARDAMRSRPDMRVLLTSGFPGVRGIRHRMEGVSFPLINKPYGQGELARTVRGTLARDGKN